MLIKTVSYRYPVTEAAKICSTDHGESWWGRTAGPLTHCWQERGLGTASVEGGAAVPHKAKHLIHSYHTILPPHPECLPR